MSTIYQNGTNQVIAANQGNSSQAVTEYGNVTLDPMLRNDANQTGNDYGSLMLDLNQSTMERHIAEAKVQLNIARDQLRMLTKANRDLIAGNVTSHVATGSITIGGVLYAVLESRLDFGLKLGRLQFSGALGGLPVGVNSYNGGAEFFSSPDQLAALGAVDIQVDATPAHCFICWRHHTRILGAFYGTGSGVSGFAASGTGTFKLLY